MLHKRIQTAGWVLSFILAVLFGMSAFMKLSQNEAAITQAASIGIHATTYQIIGVVEIISLILFLVPRTGLLGGLFLIAYMGGAIATHLQHGQPILMPVMIQVVLWLAVALRFPEVLKRLFPSVQQLFIER